MQSLYSSLPLKDQEIRVLTIIPDDWATAIHCKLNIVSLDDALEFTALSYVWGMSMQDGTLCINGREQRIGRSLETALRYYRRAGWHMPLWVDAVCINQDDVSERSSQVAIMACIYSSAAIVFVVLGAGIDLAEDDYFQKVMTLQRFRFSTYGQGLSGAILPPGWERGNSQAVLKDEKTSVLFAFLEGAVDLKSFDHLGDVGRWGAVSRDLEESDYPWQILIQILEDFTREAWWTRAWTLQESVVGIEPIFVYRTAAAPWALVREVAGSMDTHISDCCTPYLVNEAPPRYAASVRKLITYVKSVEETRDVYDGIYHGSEVDQHALNRLLGIRKDFAALAVADGAGSLELKLLYAYLWMHHRRDASDSRDKVYALLSLTKLRNAPSFIYPDYGKGEEDVYISTARAIIQDSASLDLLSAAGKFRSNKFPSWVPDWSIVDDSDEITTQMRALLTYNASLETEVEVSFHESSHSLLSAEGLILDHIGVLGQRATPEVQDGRDMWHTIFAWMQIAHAHSSSTKWVDFCRTICTDLLMWPRDRVFRRMGPISGKYTQDVPQEELTQLSVEQMKTCFLAWHLLLERQAMRGVARMAAGLQMEDQVKITTAFRRFAVLSLGYIGLVPSSSEEGDCVVFFRGCRFPFVVRPIARPENKAVWYKVVGDCYIHGFMDGQIKDHVLGKTGDRGSDWKIITLC
ncbi:hypothetical protein B7463_g3209, partial [Scytalidium lignicola]